MKQVSIREFKNRVNALLPKKKKCGKKVKCKTIIKPEQRDKYKTDFNSYSEYLKSPLWKRIRKKFLRKKIKCQVCKLEPYKEVHHKKYRKYGMEEWSDLIAVCHTCHFQKFHHTRWNDERVNRILDNMV